MKKVVIVGLGLIGASLGLALRQRGTHVTGVDLPEVLGLDSAKAAADVVLPIGADERIHSAFSGSELTILAIPVSRIVALLPIALEHAPCVTDCGSTKRAISQAAQLCLNSERFVPGHPMAGLPGGGAASARADLFLGCNWLVCPAHASEEALSTVRGLLHALGSNAVEMTAEAHDAAVALTSHLPQLLGSIVKLLAHEQSASVAAGPSFERLTRAAGGAENIWKDIFVSNGDDIARTVRALIGCLEPLASELEALGPARGAGATPAKVLELLALARAAL